MLNGERLAVYGDTLVCNGSPDREQDDEDALHGFWGSLLRKAGEEELGLALVGMRRGASRALLHGQCMAATGVLGLRYLRPCHPI